MSPQMLDTRARMTGKGRFEPTEPLHMTTRKAARNGLTNGTPSINGSIDDNESRRGSLEGRRPTTSSGSLGSQTSAKRRRISEDSNHSASDLNISFDSRASATRDALNGASRLLSSPIESLRVQTSPAPSRKRKRTSSPSPPTRSNAIDPNLNSPIITNATEADLDAFRDAAVVVDPEDLSDRESERTSNDGPDTGPYMVATQSTEMTPAVTPAPSAPPSPASDDTNPTPAYPIKHVDVVMVDADQLVDADDADIDETEPMADPDDAYDAAEGEYDDSHVISGPRKRMTGRRRADHPDVVVEAKLRRQLHLKSSYRALARAIKPVLAEIASKTMEELESDPKTHERAAEYTGTAEHEGVRSKLDDILARRKAQLDAQMRLTKQMLREKLEGECHVRKQLCQHDIDDAREQNLHRLEHESLNIFRQSRIDASDAQNDTEDEDDDVILRPKAIGYRFERREALDVRHYSRSHFALECQQTSKDTHLRVKMQRMLGDLRTQDARQEAATFTVMDSITREAALEKREGYINTHVLADAAAELERIARFTIPNKDALGLQLLGDLASRPSISAVVAAPPTAPRLDEPFRLGPAHHHQMLPPHSTRLAVEPLPNGILHISPGTEQFLQRSMPHFSPPRNSRQSSMSDDPPSVLSPFSRSGPGYDYQIAATKPRYHDATMSGTPQHRRHVSRDSLESGIAGRAGPDAQQHGHSNKIGSPWERYRRPLTVDAEAPSAPSNDRQVHDFCRGGPLSIERLAPQPQTHRASIPETRSMRSSDKKLNPAPHMHERVLTEAAVKKEPQEQALPRPQEPVYHSEPMEIDMPEPQTSSRLTTHSIVEDVAEGAPDSRPTGEAAVPGPAPEIGARDVGPDALTLMRKSRSRASSLGQSTDVSGSQDGDSAGRTKEQAEGTRKPSKVQRQGLSRKGHRAAKGSKKSQFSGEGGSQMFRFRLNPANDASKPHHWPTEPMTHGPLLPHPRAEMPSYAAPQAHGQPPSYNQQAAPPHLGPQFGFGHYNHHYYPEPDRSYPHHRNSLPDPGAPIHPQYSHYGGAGGYGPPPGPHPMAPPDGWSGSPGPGGAPPHPARQSQASPGSYGPQFGGPPIAPATPDSRHPYGTGPPGGNHLPAFAQQQRNAEGSGSRRRTQSDAPRGTKFQHYVPKEQK